MVRTPCFQSGGTCSIPGRGTKITHAAWFGQKKKKKDYKGMPVLVRMRRKCGLYAQFPLAFVLGGDVNGVATLEKRLAFPQTVKYRITI